MVVVTKEVTVMVEVFIKAVIIVAAENTTTSGIGNGSRVEYKCSSSFQEQIFSTAVSRLNSIIAVHQVSCLTG